MWQRHRNCRIRPQVNGFSPTTSAPVSRFRVSTDRWQYHHEWYSPAQVQFRVYSQTGWRKDYKDSIHQHVWICQRSSCAPDRTPAEASASGRLGLQKQCRWC